MKSGVEYRAIRALTMTGSWANNFNIIPPDCSCSRAQSRSLGSGSCFFGEASVKTYVYITARLKSCPINLNPPRFSRLINVLERPLARVKGSMLTSPQAVLAAQEG